MTTERRIRLAAGAALAAILAASAAGAADCVDAIAAASARHQVPAALLYAVALTESGRAGPAGTRPNPYAVNIDGAGYHFDTLEAAVAQVKAAQGRHARYIDVGCMQVDLHHHPNAFPSLEAAFDPGANAEYGTRYLKDLAGKYGNWTSAVAYYHAGTAGPQWSYVCQVHSRLASWGMAQPGACQALRDQLGAQDFRPPAAGR